MKETIEQETAESLEIAELIARARAAQAQIANLSQEEVRHIARCIGWLAIDRADVWAKVNFEETHMGDEKSKSIRTRARARGLMRDLNEAKTVGIIEEDPAKQLVKIAKPVGVIGALVPITVPAGVVFIKAMNGLMGRNALIYAPHPRAKKITAMVVSELRALLKRLGYPEDLLICIDNVSMAKTNELMKQCDLIIATGGAGMVKAAYSSGTPAYGVGAGNVVSVIDETADLKDAAFKIMDSQMNDLASGCSTENSLVIQESVYQQAIQEMKNQYAYLCTPEDKAKLQATLWKNGRLNGDVICRPATEIAKAAGMNVPEDTRWILVEETGYGSDYPFSGEKLSVVVTVYKYDAFDEAIALVNGIQSYSGAGHSCGIHSFNEEHIQRFAMETKTARVAVRMPQNKSNAGNWNNGMPFTITLGCGTWGGNITCENITAKHYINTTWVAREIKDCYVPSDEELFGAEVMNDPNVLNY